MGIEDDFELAVTRQKLTSLQEAYEKSKAADHVNEHVKRLSLQSLKKWINRLTEEIVRYESKVKAAS